ncbi:hypothetical protein AB3662_22130 [Sorangium cellulosum]|uniref:hypothetical protein n=1 Tax=Sorangium cellulosum TaxID=56 RepID=UPI003D9A2F1A
MNVHIANVNSNPSARDQIGEAGCEDPKDQHVVKSVIASGQRGSGSGGGQTGAAGRAGAAGVFEAPTAVTEINSERPDDDRGALAPRSELNGRDDEHAPSLFDPAAEPVRLPWTRARRVQAALAEPPAQAPRSPRPVGSHGAPSRCKLTIRGEPFDPSMKSRATRD